MKSVRVSPAVSIYDLGAARGADQAFVITNEATGQHFSADAPTVQFLDALRRTGEIPASAAQAGLALEHGVALVQQFAQRGIVAGLDVDVPNTPTKGPIEGKLISVKADLADAAKIARQLSWVGSLMFSLPMAVLWAGLVAYAIAVFLTNGDKVTTSFMLLTNLQSGYLFAFIVLFLFLKAVHELGHILAYRVMSLREGIDPGPIRVGIMVFAATPFPFTDVTGAWRIASKWRRAMIGAAGVYFETFCVALLTLAWARLDLGVFEPVILQVAVFSGALTLLFNLNPAVKLDGYYVFTDLFRQPNLVGRASQAARAFAARRLGVAAPKPDKIPLVYWLISYAYRWTIFAGVFWLAYRFDPRLATVVAVVTGMLLIVRPIIATVRPLMKKLSLLRLAGALSLVLILIGLSLIPFRARLLAEGQLLTFETEYLFPPEAAQLIGSGTDGNTPTFAQPRLVQDKLGLSSRLVILDNLSRRTGLPAVEIAALRSDRSSVEEQLSDVVTRIERLSPHFALGSVVSPISSERFDGQWISTSLAEPLAAVSLPTAAKLRIQLPQNQLEENLGSSMIVRMVGAAGCEFPAVLTSDWSDAVARDGIITIDATPSDRLPQCAQSVRSGAAIIARFPLSSRSFAQRVKKRVNRLLQERLPFEREL
jgi:hypothetical protein